MSHKKTRTLVVLRGTGEPGLSEHHVLLYRRKGYAVMTRVLRGSELDDLRHEVRKIFAQHSSRGAVVFLVLSGAEAAEQALRAEKMAFLSREEVEDELNGGSTPSRSSA